MIWSLSISADHLRLAVTSIAMAALFISASSAYAQSDGPVEAGTLVTPKGDLPLRAAPPEGFFGTKGSDLGQATANQKYRVLQQKTIPTFSDAQVWLQLQDVKTGNTGWVYSGTGNAPLENLDKTP